MMADSRPSASWSANSKFADQFKESFPLCTFIEFSFFRFFNIYLQCWMKSTREIQIELSIILFA